MGSVRLYLRFLHQFSTADHILSIVLSEDRASGRDGDRLPAISDSAVILSFLFIILADAVQMRRRLQNEGVAGDGR